MIRAVLDTNVLVSGLLSPAGAPGWIVDLVTAGELSIAYDGRILAEYREVLERPELGLSKRAVRAALEAIARLGMEIVALPWPHRLPDGDDEPFLAVASAVRVVLVTGNLRHFPTRVRGGVEVETPRQFLNRWAARSSL